MTAPPVQVFEIPVVIQPDDIGLYEKVASQSVRPDQPIPMQSPPIAANIDAMLGELWR